MFNSPLTVRTESIEWLRMQSLKFSVALSFVQVRGLAAQLHAESIWHSKRSWDSGGTACTGHYSRFRCLELHRRIENWQIC
jgi:hypothetical protein